MRAVKISTPTAEHHHVILVFDIRRVLDESFSLFAASEPCSKRAIRPSAVDHRSHFRPNQTARSPAAATQSKMLFGCGLNPIGAVKKASSLGAPIKITHKTTIGIPIIANTKPNFCFGVSLPQKFRVRGLVNFMIFSFILNSLLEERHYAALPFFRMNPGRMPASFRAWAKALAARLRLCAVRLSPLRCPLS